MERGERSAQSFSLMALLKTEPWVCPGWGGSFPHSVRRHTHYRSVKLMRSSRFLRWSSDTFSSLSPTCTNQSGSIFMIHGYELFSCMIYVCEGFPPVARPPPCNLHYMRGNGLVPHYSIRQWSLQHGAVSCPSHFPSQCHIKLVWVRCETSSLGGVGPLSSNYYERQ